MATRPDFFTLSSLAVPHGNSDFIRRNGLARKRIAAPDFAVLQRDHGNPSVDDFLNTGIASHGFMPRQLVEVLNEEVRACLDELVFYRASTLSASQRWRWLL